MNTNEITVILENEDLILDHMASIIQNLSDKECTGKDLRKALADKRVDMQFALVDILANLCNEVVMELVWGDDDPETCDTPAPVLLAESILEDFKHFGEWDDGDEITKNLESDALAYLETIKD